MSDSPKTRSRLVRLALFALALLAIVAAILLVVEGFKFTQGMPDKGRNVQVGRIVGLILINILFTCVITAAAVLIYWGKISVSLPNLKGWHTEEPPGEFRANDQHDDYRLDDYLIQERTLFKELNQRIAGAWANQSPGFYSRFRADSPCNPENAIDENWNRTRTRFLENPVGGVLLLHGLSDSPYSLRTIGERFVAEGYSVIWLRMPGHGTCPAGLANVSSADWNAAVSMAARTLREHLPEQAPMFLCGYSNGGALSVYYSLCSLDSENDPTPDGIVLLSPMIGVSPLARVTRLHHTVGLITRSPKSRWNSIYAEIDPFKYCSWPMNANVQAWSVTKAVERKMVELEKAGRADQFPPVLTFQSVVDSTVVVPKLITVLFERLQGEFNELFLVDVNRYDALSNLVNRSFEKSVMPKLSREDRKYRLTALRNTSPHTKGLSLFTGQSGAEWEGTETGLEWPDQVVSLSHVALPFPPDDRVYGNSPDNAANVSLGTLSIRAEPGTLMIPASMFFRCRSNPFYHFMEDYLFDWIAKVVDQAGKSSS